MSAVKKLIPLMDRVLVERAVAATKTSGGILLPETVGSKLNAGVVVAVGPGRPSPMDGKLIPNGVKAGDKVLLPEFGGQAVKLDEGPQKKEFLLYRDEEILGILQD
ncbi:unnamed protein product [Bathycoccus prasinos]|jgi:chaperonin GroES